MDVNATHVLGPQLEDPELSAVQGTNTNLFGRVPSSANMSTNAFTQGP
jgi:hypothetical protein